MSSTLSRRTEVRGYRGLRLTADEYFALPNDGGRYELIDGVVQMSPSPNLQHQDVVAEFFRQLSAHVYAHKLGKSWVETDAHLGPSPRGGDLVYRPDLMFIRAERARALRQRVQIPPDLVVEVVLPDSGHLDYSTKREDYERAGVGEYWIIDPYALAMTFLRLKDGRFVEAPSGPDFYESETVTGLRLELAPIRALFGGE